MKDSVQLAEPGTVYRDSATAGTMVYALCVMSSPGYFSVSANIINQHQQPVPQVLVSTLSSLTTSQHTHFCH